MASRNNSNELLKFMSTTTSSLQEALERSRTKPKKVNHRKYLEKRLQKGPRSTKKPKPTANTASNVISLCGRQPVAGLTADRAPNATQVSQQYIQNEYDHLYQIVSSPSVFPTSSSNHSFAHSRPPTPYDPEIESLLSEFADSPSQSSLYGDSTSRGGSRGSLVSSMCSSTSFSMENSLITQSESYVSDFSDFDESNYSSPINPSPINACYSTLSPPSPSRNPSPVNPGYRTVSPASPPDMFYCHNLSATYDCIPTSSTFAVDRRPDGGLLPYNPSLTDIIDLVELVSTP